MSLSGPVIVLTPGRVGTRTVWNSLRQAGIPAVLVHKIGPALDASIPQYKRQSPNPAAKIERALDVEKDIRRARLLGSKVGVITLVRDPIDRAISMMFLLFATGTLDQRCADQGLERVVSQMRDEFLAALPSLLDDFTSWYANVLPHAIDTATPPFIRGADYSIFSTTAADCLFMPMERFGRLSDALEEFTGQSVRVLDDGVSKVANPIASRIRECLEQSVDLSPTQLDAVYDQPIIRLVYDEATIASFKTRWGG